MGSVGDLKMEWLSSRVISSHDFRQTRLGIAVTSNTGFSMQELLTSKTEYLNYTPHRTVRIAHVWA
eukprot:COSAG02_NODE_15926_length_1129_cov_1.033981_1_plen_66_part_00